MVMGWYDMLSDRLASTVHHMNDIIARLDEADRDVARTMVDHVLDDVLAAIEAAAVEDNSTAKVDRALKAVIKLRLRTSSAEGRAALSQAVDAIEEATEERVAHDDHDWLGYH